MKEVVKRIVSEKEELDKKLDALTSFIPTERFEGLSLHHQKLLLAQQATMTRYSDILTDRLILIKAEGNK